MRLTSFQFAELFQGKACFRIAGGAYRKGDQRFVRMKTGILASQVSCLQFLDRMNGFGGDHMMFVIDPGQNLQRVQKKGGGSAQKVGGLSVYDLSVG